MIEALFWNLERRRHVEDLFAVLDRDDAAVGKVATIQAAVHLVHNRRVEIAAAQEVGVQRVHYPVRDRCRSGGQGLSQHLTAEHLRTADIAAFATKQVDLERLQLEQIQQIGNLGIHKTCFFGEPNLRTPRIDELWRGKVHRYMYDPPFLRTDVGKVTVALSPPPTTLVLANTFLSPGAM